jgi:CheY-like chemotaxis protein
MNQKPPVPAAPRQRPGFAGFFRPPADRAVKILVADDDENFLECITTVLARAAFSVTAVADGEQAWERLHQEGYDLLVTDQDMPRLTGIGLIGRMRKAGLRLPVILASGSLSGEALRDYPQLQITALVPKPFDAPEFINVVNNALPRSEENAAAGRGREAGGSASPAPASAPMPRPAQLEKCVRKHVLIADDDAVVRGSLAAVLQSEGYAVEEAGDGIEAVNRALKHKPDLVLLDLNMPNADGWTAFNQLDRVTPLLPVVVITDRPNQYPEAVRVGVDAFMEKPLNIPVLVRAVKHLTHEEEGRHVRRITDRKFVTRLLDSANT